MNPSPVPTESPGAVLVLPTPAPTPNPEEVLRFFEIVAPGERITFQLFSDRKLAVDGAPHAAILHGHPADLMDQLLRRNQHGAGVFWMVSQGDLQGRRKENVVAIRHLFVDLDGSPVEPALTIEVPPTVVVETSPGRYHVYWAVKGCPVEHFPERQLQLADRFAGDPKVANINAVLRVPGFLHQKVPSRPFRSRILLPAPEK